MQVSNSGFGEHEEGMEESGAPEAPQRSPSSHSAKAPLSCSDEPAVGYARADLALGPKGTLKKGPDRVRGSRPRQAAARSQPVHTRAPSLGHREPPMH